MYSKEIRIGTGIVKRGKSYRFTVSLGYDGHGKQIRKTRTFRPPAGINKRESDRMAHEEYLRFFHQCKGFCILRENMRFQELVDEYFRIHAPGNLKPITVYNYSQQIQRHFFGAFGARRLKDFTPAMIRDYLHSLVNPQNGESPALSAASVRKLYHILQSLFRFALRQGYISETPCRNISLPRVAASEGRMYLTAGELDGFLSLFHGYTPVHTIIMTLLYTGMRTGECLALKWTDLDFAARSIRIRHSLSYVRGEHLLTSVKTASSERVLYMSDALGRLLHEHYEHQQCLIESSDHFPHPEMVFTSETGNYKARNSLYTSLKRIVKDTPYSFMTLHKLRHTNATLLLNNGIDLKIVSEHLGHSAISVTADIYTAVLDQSRIKTADTIEKILNKHRENT